MPRLNELKRKLARLLPPLLQPQLSASIVVSVLVFSTPHTKVGNVGGSSWGTVSVLVFSTLTNNSSVAGSCSGVLIAFSVQHFQHKE